MDFVMNALLVIFVLGLIVCGMALVIIIVSEVKKCFLEYKEFSVTVPIVDKKYKASYTTTTMMRVGKVTVPQTHFHPSRHNVYVEWRENIYPIDNEYLFNKFKVDDVIVAKAHVGYNKAGVEKDVYLTYE